MTTTTTRYVEPTAFEAKVFARVLNGLMHLGVSAKGSRILEHRGRTSGATFRTPVNLLHHDGCDYLVAPRGETQWVRNVRAADGELTLVLGRRRRTYRAVEVPVAERTPMIRAYLEQWAWEVGKFFEGIDASSSDEEIAAVAAGFPVFRLA
ncbi:MAG TPA: nitroreductase/quinone reductase family protein [Mycobacteriales bacterium]|nr:nitroreductase/quinone reductase family protein [Mycobacteriales bacterium]